MASRKEGQGPKKEPHMIKESGNVKFKIKSETRCINRLSRLETDNNWYYVPPYTTHEDEIVVDAAGQRIAVFEVKEDALACVEARKKYVDKLNPIYSKEDFK